MIEDRGRSADLLTGTKDQQTVTAEWNGLDTLIDGVAVREVRNVIKPGGDVLCEIFRLDWLPDGGRVEHAFQVAMNPGSVSAWHAHARTIDRLFVSQGVIRIVLYDGRDGSPTRGRINEFRFGEARPALVVIPRGVWHGVQNLSPTRSVILNLSDAVYDYEDPDHWRLPADTNEIPYRFR